jgi:hypothetical protein
VALNISKEELEALIDKRVAKALMNVSQRINKYIDENEVNVFAKLGAAIVMGELNKEGYLIRYKKEAKE